MTHEEELRHLHCHIARLQAILGTIIRLHHEGFMEAEGVRINL